LPVPVIESAGEKRHLVVPFIKFCYTISSQNGAVKIKGER
jgi:hypothetical protein